jgi:hypothetical protein
LAYFFGLLVRIFSVGGLAVCSIFLVCIFFGFCVVGGSVVSAGVGGRRFVFRRFGACVFGGSVVPSVCIFSVIGFGFYFFGRRFVFFQLAVCMYGCIFSGLYFFSRLVCIFFGRFGRFFGRFGRLVCNFSVGWFVFFFGRFGSVVSAFCCGANVDRSNGLYFFWSAVRLFVFFSVFYDGW